MPTATPPGKPPVVPPPSASTILQRITVAKTVTLDSRARNAILKVSSTHPSDLTVRFTLTYVPRRGAARARLADGRRTVEGAALRQKIAVRGTGALRRLREGRTHARLEMVLGRGRASAKRTLAVEIVR